MRWMLSVGCAMAVAVAALAFYAVGEDDYYGDGTTRWEHATKDGGGGLLAALFVVPALAACVFIALGFVKKRTSELWLLAVLVVYVLSLAYAWAALSLGH